MSEWATQEWRDRAESWIHDRLAGVGITTTAPIEQPRTRFWSTLLLARTDQGVFWFKENCPAQSFEARLVAAMSLWAPDHVVPPLAVEPTRGWMLSAHQGHTLRESGPVALESWIRVVQEYADLQRRLVPHAGDLVAVGLPTLPLRGIGEHLANRVAALAALPADDPAHIDADRARALEGEVGDLAELGRLLADGPVPLSFDHNDLHPNNVFVSASGDVRVFDLGDALLTHPFCSLLIATRTLGTEDWDGPWRADAARLRDAYLEVWSDLAERQELVALFDAALRIGCLNRAVSWSRILADADPAGWTRFGDSEGFWLEAHRGPLHAR